MRASPHPFTLRQLQYVLAVAELRSFRRAAAACHVSQPSLSAQVAQVEEALGLRIFERDKRGVLITHAGEAVLERMKRVVVEADDLLAAATRARDPLASTLRIGVIPTVAPYLLPELGPALRAAHPRLGVVWVEEKTRVLREQLERGELDAAIVAVESELGDLETIPIGEDPFVLATALGHPLSKAKRLAKLEELGGERVLLLEDGHCLRDQALSLCREVGAEESAMRATSLPTLAQIVAGGGGVTLLPSIAVSTESRGGGLAVRAFAPRAPARTLALAFRKSTPIREALATIAETLRKAYAEVRKKRG